MQLSTPVLLLVFNRPEHTQKVFQQIRKVQPEYLFISADGPRANHASDAEKCLQTRAIVQQIDWKCSVNTLFRDENLGCKKAVQTGIDWFFQHVEAGIILEDDCMPDESFFHFCTLMLREYAGDQEVMHISGSNPCPERCTQMESAYLFSRFPFIWGWATWRRAWSQYSSVFQDLEETWNDPDSAFTTLIADSTARRYLYDKFLRTRDGEIDTWDYAWFYTILQRRGFCITPLKNMVQNIGFDRLATHTHSEKFRRQPGVDPLSTIEPASRTNKKRRNMRIENAFFYASQKSAPGLLLRKIAPYLFFKPLPARPQQPLAFWNLNQFMYTQLSMK